MQVGLTERLPQLIGIQSEAIQPVVSRYHGHALAGEPRQTLAASIAVQKPRNYLRLHAELAASQGMMLAVTDSEMQTAQELLAREAGVVAELTSAATLAGLLRAGAASNLAGKTAVLVITGGRIDGDS